ncbi:MULTISPECIES: flagellar assembly protein T N-terminal domain-containing protein [Psychromonas]|uniref:flagellar assembly protein T N-terminal domain-containing protein n=1 Tax=Psychromonas TaxID=67572 RepID=UPI000421C159|nr:MULTISPECIES: flagellar assembly protein T N-terminal domain-containing protein [Psychromonas]MBB1274308.1 flagellar assembly protein T N-terminal domain-containing protein [Psychromonas sp. SR45-3]
MKKVVFILLLISSINASAQWFQASANASIINDDIGQAREQAIKKAVKDALLFSGGAISSLQQVNQGVLVENKLILNSGGEIKALKIIEETQKNKLLTVSIKVNIVAREEQCIGSQFPKSIVISRFAMNVPQHTVDGQIYDLHKKVSETFFNQLSLSPNLFNIRRYIDTPLKLGEKYNNRNLTNTLSSLSAQTDSQFVIFGEVNDLSVKFESKNSLTYWVSNPDRHFYMTVYLYDAFQGQLLFSKQYRQSTSWQYGKEEYADLNSKQFWDYQYGQAILTSLAQANTDISQHIQCVIPKARVIAVTSDSVQINLGIKNGLQPGTIIELAYASNFKDQFGIERQSATTSAQAMKVVEVYADSAVLSTLDEYPLSNIQINDIATIKSIQ